MPTIILRCVLFFTLKAITFCQKDGILIYFNGINYPSKSLIVWSRNFVADFLKKIQMIVKLQMYTKINLMVVFMSFSAAQAQVPNEPTNLVVTPINTGGMIQFSEPSSIGYSTITNYEYSIDNGINWVTPTTVIKESPIIINSGITNCTSYQVKIRAVNDLGKGTPSATVTLKPSNSNHPGMDWTSRTNPVDNSWNGIIYANGLFVAVGGSSSGNGVMTSSDGNIWTARTTPADNEWFGITYGNGLFVAVAISGVGNRVMTSTDGINWTARASAADNNWLSVTYGNGLFVAVAFSGVGNRVMTSPDGINWTTRSSPVDNDWFGITYGNGLFVAIGQTGFGNRVMTSPDGINWTVRTSAVDLKWRSITYGKGLFVAVAYTRSTSSVMTSPDGIIWTARLSAANNNWNSVSYGNGLFAAVSSSGSGNRVMTSFDGFTWTIRASAENNYWNSITYGNGHFVAVAATGTSNRVMTSSFSLVADAPLITEASFSGTTTTIQFTQSGSLLAPAITNYEYFTNDSTTWTALSPADTTSPLTINGLANVPSLIMIRAVNSVGNSCPSTNYLNNYNVTFDANGGSGSMAVQTIDYNVSANLRTNAFTRTGYTFSGWATTSVGTVAYANSASYTMGATDVTLFAKWTATSGSNGAITQVRPIQCGKTLSYLTSAIQASPLVGATEYTFEVTRVDNSVVNTIVTSNYYFFPATLITGGLVYGKSYSVKVKAKIGGIYQAFGNACIVTAPSEPLVTTTKIRPMQCGKTLNYITDAIQASPVYLATQYEFNVTDGVTTVVIPSSASWFRLSQFPGGGVFNTAYTITVRSKGLATAFTAYRDSCIVTTPISRMSDSLEKESIFNVKAFPNPFASHFSLDIESSSDDLVQLKVYDMIGRQLEVRKATVTELSTKEIGANYPSGVYNVVVSQGDNVKSLRIIKR
ncbi:InlB B-repeat-containing protein [Flavobacterium luteum]|nr:InlB B-repeat-containing protein [Flavobacterium luteum]